MVIPRIVQRTCSVVLFLKTPVECTPNSSPALKSRCSSHQLEISQFTSVSTALFLSSVEDTEI